MRIYNRSKLPFFSRTTSLLQSIWRRHEGIAALEFAIVTPLMAYTLLAFSDVAGALTVTRRMTNAVDTIAELVSQQTEGGSKTQAGTPTSVINNAEILEDFDSILTTLPEVTKDAARRGENWQSDLQLIVSSVEFAPTSTCIVQEPGQPTVSIVPTCKPYVVWSVGLANTTTGYPTSTRTCGVSTWLSANTESPRLTAFPPGTYTPGTALSPGTIIAVDLVYIFRPTFTDWLTGPFTYQRTAYFPPRFFTQLSYTAPSSKPTVSGTQNLYPAAAAGSLTSCTYNGTIPS